MTNVNQVPAGEWQPSSGYGFVQPPTDMFPKSTSEVPDKGVVMVFDRTTNKFKIPTADTDGYAVITKVKSPLVADDPEGAARFEGWFLPGYRYTVIAAEALDPWGYGKVANGGKIAKWVHGTDTAKEIICRYVQRPNVTPPQNSGKHTLEANDVDEVVGVLWLAGGEY